MTIVSDLERARRLIFAADEIAAKEFAAVAWGADRGVRPRRTAVGGLRAARRDLSGPHGVRPVSRCVCKRINDCMAIYLAVRAGTNPEAAAKVTMSDCRPSTTCSAGTHAGRSSSGRDWPPACHGDHDAAEAGLLVLTDDTSTAFS